MKQILMNRGLEEAVAEQFVRYFDLLVEWNEKMNLTAITEQQAVAEKHFLDSLGIFTSGLVADGSRVMDVGAGAGFPSIPMKLYQPSLSITMVDSLQKRVGFLETVCRELHLSDICAIHGRAEEIGHDPAHRECYDLCVARAVAKLSTLSELCLPFVKVGGYFIAMKGPGAQEELAEAEHAISLLGGRAEGVLDYSVAGADLQHCLVVVKKISQILPKYPRKAPKPSREPLK